MRSAIAAFSIVLLVSINCFAFSSSENVGTTSFPFLLKMDIGARSTALAGAWIGWAKSADGFAHNPAAAALMKSRGATASFGNYWGLFNAGFAGYYHSVSENTGIAAGVRMVSYGGDFIRTDSEGNEHGTFSAGDFALYMTYAIKISKTIAVGLTMKPIYSSADTFTASALCADIGTIIKFQRDKARVGIVLSNLGAMLSTYGENKYPLPMMAKIGGYYTLPGFPGSFGAQIETGNDVDIAARMGIEFDFLKPAYLRVGYIFRPKPEEGDSDIEVWNGLTAGTGFDYKKVSFNYSMQHYGVLGIIHKFDLAYWGF